LAKADDGRRRAAVRGFPMFDRVAWKQLGWILFVALVVRVGAVVVWQQRLRGDFGFPDTESYWQLAQRLAAGERYVFRPADQPIEYRIFRTPGYPAVLAPIFWFLQGGSAVWAARFQSVAFSVATVALVAFIAAGVFGWPTARIAALITAFYPEAIAAGAFILSESLFCPLMLAQLLFWLRAEQSPTRRAMWTSAAGAGVCGGLAVLVRPSWLLFVPMAGLGLLIISALQWLRPRTNGQPAAISKRWIIIGVVLGMSVLTMLPWWWRNWRVSGRFVPTSLQVGASLYDGLNPAADGGSNMAFTRQFVEKVLAAEGDVPRSGLQREIELDRRMRNAAFDWLRAHPRQALQLAGRKLLRMWLPGPNDSALASVAVRFAVASTYLPVMLLAVYSLWRGRHWRWPLALLWLPAVYFTGLHVVFVASIRYRLPAMLCLIVLAADGGVRLWACWANRTSREGVAAAGREEAA